MFNTENALNVEPPPPPKKKTKQTNQKKTEKSKNKMCKSFISVNTT